MDSEFDQESYADISRVQLLCRLNASLCPKPYPSMILVKKYVEMNDPF